MNKAVLIDRDGTLNIEKNYLYKVEDFEFTQNAIEAIRKLNDSGFLVIVITNQAGIARGYYTEKDLEKLHIWMNEELSKYNAKIDKFYYCPHHPIHGLGLYKQECNCRKPNNGLYLRAIEEFNIDTSNSYVIGDKITDLIPGKNSGMKTVLVRTGYGIKERTKDDFYDYEEENLASAVELILQIQHE